MTTAMKAAFTLTLEDKLSSGLGNIQKQMEQLRNKGSQLNLGKLEKSGDVVRTLAREIQNLTSDLRRVESVAERAFGALRRIASVQVQRIKGWGQNAFGSGGFSGATSAIAGVASGVSLMRPVQKLADFQDAALMGAMAQGLNGPKAIAETKRLMAVFNRDAMETGQHSMAIAGAYRGMIKGGLTPAQAEELLPIHSRAATAYNIDPEALGNPVAAMRSTLKIDEKDMPGALAAMHAAAQTGRFDVQDFAMQLPGIAGNMAKLGMTGRGNADRAFASLETIMQYSSQPNQAAADYNDLLNDIVSPTAARQFGLHNKGMTESQKHMLAKYHVRGIDLPRVLEKAEQVGIDPQTALLNAVHRSLDGLPHIIQAEALGAFVGNSQARNALQALFDHKDHLQTQIKDLGNSDAGKLDVDYETRRNMTKVTLDTGAETATQLERRVGQGFEPVVTRLMHGMESFLNGIDALDKRLPGLADAVFNVTGAMLAAISALAAAGFVAPAVKAGALLARGVAPSLVLPAAGAAILVTPGDTVSGKQPTETGLRSFLGQDSPIGKWFEHLFDGHNTVLEQLKREREPSDGASHDSLGADGRPVEVIPPISRAPGTLEITIHTDPGTTATINRATDGIRSTLPDVGNTVTRP